VQSTGVLHDGSLEVLVQSTGGCVFSTHTPSFSISSALHVGVVGGLTLPGGTVVMSTHLLLTICFGGSHAGGLTGGTLHLGSLGFVSHGFVGSFVFFGTHVSPCNFSKDLHFGGLSISGGPVRTPVGVPPAPPAPPVSPEPPGLPLFPLISPPPPLGILLDVVKDVDEIPLNHYSLASLF
jgi:hypothetical protein